MDPLNGPEAPLYNVLISLTLGLLVGLQREWADSKLGGIRTFALVALLGTVCAFLGDKFGAWIVAAGFLGTIAAMVVGGLRIERKPSGLGTEFAMLLTFGVGVLVHVGPWWLAAAVAGIVAVILQMKLELQGFADRFDEREIKAIMQFALISLVILPAVPDVNVGPYQVLNPRNIWTMVILIVFISLAGFIIYKMVGESAGVWVAGILGGTISSTATTVSYSKQARKGKELQPALIILIAWAIMYIRVALEIKAVAPSFQAAWLPLGILLLVSVGFILWMWRKAGAKNDGMPPQKNPTELRTALTFAAIYSVILVAVAYAKEHFGSSGLHLVALISGVTDVDAITLSTSRLVSGGTLSPEEAWPVIIIAVLSNVFSKGMLTLYLGGKGLFKVILPSWIATLLIGLTLIVTL